MPIPSALVTRFFQLLINKQLAEANRELEKIKQKMHKTEWNRGYFRALRGMLISRRSNSGQYTFFSSLDFNDGKALQNYRKEFRAHVKSKLHDDFDRGFFSAWAESMRVLSKLVVNNPGVNKASSMKGKPETRRNNVGQAKIERFLERKNRSGY